MDRIAQLLQAARTALEFHTARFSRAWFLAFVSAALIVGGSYQWLLATPASFVPGTIIIVPRGSSAHEAAQTFASAHVVKHPRLLELLLRMSGRSSSVQSGAYRFNDPDNIIVVAARLALGEYGIPPARFTIPEGNTVRDMAKRVHNAIPDITEAAFISAAGPYEGYLFPDTYKFQPPEDAETVVAVMRENFDTKIVSIQPAIDASGHSLSELVIMASLIEREGRYPEDKRMISGILWNRIARGMPLQVDAVFGYIYSRDTYSPSFADLKVDSPYNTYTHKGLPPGPIDSPGIASIEAAANPTKSEYLYYLTGTDGLMHYATTFAGHQANRRQYLAR